jgi:hypothetical protein
MKGPKIPPLDKIGAAPGVHCWRMRRESDRDYAWRLSLHIQTLIVEIDDRKDELEKLLTATLAIKTNPQLWEQPRE